MSECCDLMVYRSSAQFGVPAHLGRILGTPTLVGFFTGARLFLFSLPLLPFPNVGVKKEKNQTSIFQTQFSHAKPQSPISYFSLSSIQRSPTIHLYITGPRYPPVPRNRTPTLTKNTEIKYCFLYDLLQEFTYSSNTIGGQNDLRKLYSAVVTENGHFLTLKSLKCRDTFLYTKVYKLRH